MINLILDNKIELGENARYKWIKKLDYMIYYMLILYN